MHEQARMVVPGGMQWNGDLTFSHVFGGSVCFAD